MMKNNELKETDLEQVNGGQAVLPLLSTSGKEKDEQIIVGAGYIHAECPVCHFRFPVPLSRQGRKATCQECGAEFTVK